VPATNYTDTSHSIFIIIFVHIKIHVDTVSVVLIDYKALVTDTAGKTCRYIGRSTEVRTLA